VLPSDHFAAFIKTVAVSPLATPRAHLVGGNDDLGSPVGAQKHHSATPIHPAQQSDDEYFP
jgi:hypothetical protein